jgi:hypothetical protein
MLILVRLTTQVGVLLGEPRKETSAKEVGGTASAAEAAAGIVARRAYTPETNLRDDPKTCLTRCGYRGMMSKPKAINAKQP